MNLDPGTIPLPMYAFILGIIFTIPMGPAGINIIDSTVTAGIKNGAKSILGLAIAEVLYLLLAFVGYEAFSSDISYWTNLTTAISAPAVLFLGVRLIIKAKEEIIINESNKSGGHFIRSFLITASNPTLFILYIGMIGTLSTIGREVTLEEKTIFLTIFQISSIITITALATYGHLNKTKIISKLKFIRTAAGTFLSIYGAFLIIKTTSKLGELL